MTSEKARRKERYKIHCEWIEIYKELRKRMEHLNDLHEVLRISDRYFVLTKKAKELYELHDPQDTLCMIISNDEYAFTGYI